MPSSDFPAMAKLPASARLRIFIASATPDVKTFQKSGVSACTEPGRQAAWAMWLFSVSGTFELLRNTASPDPTHRTQEASQRDVKRLMVTVITRQLSAAG
jgi:hypothetical protein